MTPWLFLFSKSCRYPPGLGGGGRQHLQPDLGLGFPSQPHLLFLGVPLFHQDPQDLCHRPRLPPNPGCPAPWPLLGPATAVIRPNPHNDLHFSLSMQPQRAKLGAKHTQKLGGGKGAAGWGYGGGECLDHLDLLRSLWGCGGEGQMLAA